MNSFYSKYQFNFDGQISSSDLINFSVQNEFEKMVECESPRKYQYSKFKIGGTSCLNIDPNTGKFLLGCGNDGSLGIWSLDERRQNDELYCKRINFSARRSSNNNDDADADDDVGGSIRANKEARMVHSFETRRNKFRLYRQSSAVEAPSTPLSQSTSSRPGHKFSIRTCQWFKLDNGMFFTGSNDCTLQLWDTNGLEAVHSVKFDRRVNQIDTTDHYVVVATEDGHPRIVDLRNPTGITHLGSGTMPHEILTVHYNPVKTHLVSTGDANGCVKLWDLRKRNQLLSELSHDSPRKKAHLSHCQDLSWNSSGSQLASVGADGRLYIWSPFNQSRSPVQVGPHDLPRTRHLRRTSQRLIWFGNYILCNTDYGEIQILDSTSGKLWTKMEDPGPPTSFHSASSPPTSSTTQFSGMALQDNLSNGIGLRLYLSTGNSIYEYVP